MASSVASSSLKSGTLAPATAKPRGRPRASVTTERLVPSLPRSVGLGPVFSPTQGSLGHRPVGRQPLPVDPGHLVVSQQPQAPELVEHPGPDPFGEAPVGRGLRADPGGAQRAPLAAGAQDEEDPVQGGPVRDARIVAAQRMARSGRQQHNHPLPQRIRNPPATGLDHLAHCSPPRLHSFQTATVKPTNPPYWDRLLTRHPNCITNRIHLTPRSSSPGSPSVNHNFPLSPTVSLPRRDHC